LKKAEWSLIVKKVRTVFPDVSKSLDAESAWFEAVEDIPFSDIEKAVKLLFRETETLWPGTNLGAVLRNRAGPLVTTATVENHLHMALSLNRSADGNPYQYLKSIDATLLKMAENADLFCRDLSAESLGFRVREVSKQFVEARENKKRGFLPPSTVPVERQIEAPKTIVDLTPEQRQANLERIRGITAGIGRRV